MNGAGTLLASRPGLIDGWVERAVAVSPKVGSRGAAAVGTRSVGLKASVHAVLAKQGVRLAVSDLFGVGGRELLARTRLEVVPDRARANHLGVRSRRNYQVQVSANGTTWTMVRDVVNSDAGVDNHTGLGATGRYVRVNGTTRATGWGYSIFELQVFSSCCERRVTGLTLCL